MPPRPITRLRKLCLALPEAHEVKAWGAPTFRVRNKMFAMYAAANNHHGGGRPGVWMKAARADQRAMVKAAPDCFFVPPYVGVNGWVGVWLDGVVEWDDVAEFLREAYRLVAPKRLLDELEPAGTDADDRKNSHRRRATQRWRQSRVKWRHQCPQIRTARSC